MRNRIAVVLLLVLIPTVIIIVHTLDSTFRGVRLLLASAVVGYFLSAVLLSRLEKSGISVVAGRPEDSGVRGMFTSIVVCLAVIAAGLANSTISLGGVRMMETTIVTRDSDVGGLRGSHWIVAVKSADHGELSFRTEQPFWETAKVGDRLELPVRRGLLGFHVVELGPIE